MRSELISVALGTVLSYVAGAALAQPAQNDGVSNPGKFLLAAPAGVDSGAENKALPGSVNAGKFDMSKWKYGHAFDAPAGTKLWNPVKIKLLAGGKVTGGTVNADTSPEQYCAMANAGYDFIWTEMQHSAGTWHDVKNMWAACPHAKAVPGVRIANANETDEQHALDEGALVLIVPTIRSLAEAQEAIKWAYYPPLGGRSSGDGQYHSSAFWGDVPGGYRQTINQNLVLILMIETLDGLRDADKIAKLPGVSAIFAASGDLGNFGGYKQGDPDYETEINIVHDAAIKAGVRLCGPFAWKDRPDFTCFQAGGGGPLVSSGVAAELGALANTQGKPEVGPYSGMYDAPAAGAGRRAR